MQSITQKIRSAIRYLKSYMGKENMSIAASGFEINTTKTWKCNFYFH